MSRIEIKITEGIANDPVRCCQLIDDLIDALGVYGYTYAAGDHTITTALLTFERDL